MARAAETYRGFRRNEILRRQKLVWAGVPIVAYDDPRATSGALVAVYRAVRAMGKRYPHSSLRQQRRAALRHGQ